MHTFIDESGRALTSEAKPVACVTALVVPDKQVEDLNEWFLNIEKQQGKQIKGSKLNMESRKLILKELQQFDVFIECTAIDMKLQSDEGISEHRAKKAEFISTSLPPNNPFAHALRTKFANKILSTPNQLYLQAILSWRLIDLVMRHATIYYSQKRPEELGAFHWVIDPKEAGRITPYEDMWTQLTLPFLQSQPPLTCVTGQDYSFLDKFSITKIEDWISDSGKTISADDHALDLKKIMLENLSFPDDKNTPGLRIVDIVANTIHRMLNDGKESVLYDILGPLFFKRTGQNCINLITLSGASKEKINSRGYRTTIINTEKMNRPIWI